MPTKFPPGPPGRFLTGNLREFRRDMLAFFLKATREHGDVVLIRLGPRRIYLVSHPDLIEEVLLRNNTSFRKHYALRMNRLLLGNGLLSSEGDFWLRQRRLVQPAFQRDRIAGYGAIMVEYTERLLARWRNGEVRDVHADMTQLALEIIAKSLFDADVHVEAPEVGSALAEAQESFLARFQSLLPLPEWVPTPGNLRLRRAIRRLDAIVYRFIAQRRETAQAPSDGTGPPPRDDLLSMLLNAQDEDGSRMDDRQLRDEAMTLFLAGHDTTALTLSWAWYVLAQNPEVDAKLCAELRQVLGDRPPSVDDLPRLRYTEYVVRESMRLYPPAYAIGREALTACELGGYHVPAGQTILMCQWVTHRDPRYFANPEKFEPDRWENGLLSRLPKYAYFPFGGGPRVCIGNTFAMMEATLVLAAIARRFRFERADAEPVRPRPSLTLRPERGILMRLHARS
jgi:cytochrome P450